MVVLRASWKPDYERVEFVRIIGASDAAAFQSLSEANNVLAVAIDAYLTKNSSDIPIEELGR